MVWMPLIYTSVETQCPDAHKLIRPPALAEPRVDASSAMGLPSVSPGEVVDLDLGTWWDFVLEVDDAIPVVDSSNLRNVGVERLGLDDGDVGVTDARNVRAIR